MDLPSIGTRISHSGNIGTVRFVGPVDGTNGAWIGVEWDDPSRGKHSGTKDGKVYFSCSVPNSGSFIRPSSKISYGTSFLKALKSKYIEAFHGAAGQETIILGSSNGAIEVEAVNLDKIRGKFADLTRLREVSLDNELPATCDASEGTIRQACPSIRGLDLSKSLIPSWDVVASIAAELPNLERLALNYNRLQMPHDPARLSSSFPRLTELLLNATLISWAHMQEITSLMPRLETVEMGYNCLADLVPSAHCEAHPSVRTLNLEGNVCADWPLVCVRLQAYTSLQRLTLAENGIQRIPPCEDKAHALSSLLHLSLSTNGLAAWSDVDALPSWCPALESLMLAENPILTNSEQAQHARLFIIARIPTLIQLDGSTITPKERTDSELFYISYVSSQTYPSEATRDHEHPRYRAICEKHGTKPDDPDRPPVKDQRNLRDRLIELKLYALPEPPTASTDLSAAQTASEPLLLRVLPTLPLKAFKQRIAKAVKRRAPLRVWLLLEDGPAELEVDTNDLAWLGLEDESVLFFCFT